ncbi:MAG: hypothetical protein U9Q81_26835, partial [Pseudomonadota bacterium]|nr:hypothetical protein [Pseudomonadota bacterium]
MVLVAVSLGFLADRLWVQADSLRWEADEGLIVTAVLGSLLYAVACLFLARAWQQLLGLFGTAHISALTAAWIYAKSQIGKYVPGNVLHIVGRHFLGRTLGISHGTLALAAAGEISGLLAAASTLALIAAVVLSLGPQKGSLLWAALGAVSAAAIAVLALPRLWSFLHRRFPDLPEPDAGSLRRGLLGAFGLYLLFFITAGSILVGLVAVEKDSLTASLGALAMLVFAVSWLAGFVTPGAPAGLGIREAVIVLLLEQLGLGDEALQIALVFRLPAPAVRVRAR